MALTAGIVGLPNVGKSTLFNAITKSQVEAANYPFATIEPNVGTVEVPDTRLDGLAKIVNPEKIQHATFEFTDIAGIVRGASKGEGLGNKFLANIREVDAICHVVRCFENDDITHVDGSVNPMRDMETINLELIFADLEILQGRLSRINKKAKNGDKELQAEVVVLEKLIAPLEDGLMARTIELGEEEKEIIKSYNLLSLKPMIYVCNINEEEITLEDNDYVKQVKEFAAKENNTVVKISAKIESELVELDDESREMFMMDLGIEDSGLSRLIRVAFKTLGLSTYFTAGVKEVRAWTYVQGWAAPKCASVIHTDFEKGFIRAQVINFEDFIECGGEAKAKDAGKARLEGKDYIMKDGDVCLFRFNV